MNSRLRALGLAAIVGVVVFFIASTTLPAAVTGKSAIYGYVTDGETKLPIADVTIAITYPDGNTLFFRSEADGFYFAATGQTYGTYKLRFEKTGYEPESASVIAGLTGTRYDQEMWLIGREPPPVPVTGSLVGTVYNVRTNEPVPDVILDFWHSNGAWIGTTRTTATGQYQMYLLTQTQYMIVVNPAGVKADFLEARVAVTMSTVTAMLNIPITPSDAASQVQPHIPLILAGLAAAGTYIVVRRRSKE